MARGERAEALLKSETFQAAILALEADMQRAVMATGIKDTEKREELFAEYHGLKRVVVKLRAWAAEAAIARKDETTQG